MCRIGLTHTKIMNSVLELHSQLCNVGSSVSLGTLPRGRLLSPASMGNMHKGVIIRKHSHFSLMHQLSNFPSPTTPFSHFGGTKIAFPYMIFPQIVNGCEAGSVFFYV